jgi:hypothetical protein
MYAVLESRTTSVMLKQDKLMRSSLNPVNVVTRKSGTLTKLSTGPSIRPATV